MAPKMYNSNVSLVMAATGSERGGWRLGDSGVVGALMRAGVATGLGSSLGIRPIRESEDARGKVRSARAGYRSRIGSAGGIRARTYTLYTAVY
jgi:hypothetical protein